jgi:hypothetical protein
MLLVDRPAILDTVAAVSVPAGTAFCCWRRLLCSCSAIATFKGFEVVHTSMHAHHEHLVAHQSSVIDTSVPLCCAALISL